MNTIKDIIPKVIGSLSQGKPGAPGIAEEWQRLSGGGKTSSVFELKDGCLTVHVDCSARLVKMNAQRQEFLEALSQKHPEIKNIRFKVGKIS